MTASGRSAVLGRVRAALGGAGSEAERRASVNSRLSRHARGIVPERAQATAHRKAGLFAEMLTTQGAICHEAGTPVGAVEAMAGILKHYELGSDLRIGEDAWLAALPWTAAPDISLQIGKAEPSDRASLSHAIAGAAETGTLLLCSGPDNPTTLNFLPDTHIVILREEDIVGSYEDAFDRIRSLYPHGLPRTVNLIGGPSRTADIEQTIVLGAHGPRSLHVIVAAF